MSFAALQSHVNTTALGLLGADGVTLDGVPVQADFCEPYAQAYLDGTGAEARMPQIVVDSSLAPDSVYGKTVTYASKAYKVVDAKPDGFGFTVLMLERML